MNKTAHTAIPERKQVPQEYCWNLSSLFADEQAWEEGFRDYERRIKDIPGFKGSLGTSASALAACLKFMNSLGELEERLQYYAHLRIAEDGSDSSHQARFGRFMRAASEAQALASYQNPEIHAIPDDRMQVFLASPELKEYGILLKKILRYKPHILTEKEERLLALQEEANQTASKAFSSLTNVDMEFGSVKTAQGEKPLTNSTFQAFMLDPDRDIRKTAYEQFMTVFDRHKNTLAALYAGSVQLDLYRARVRNFPSARAASLFPDDVPESVYDTLIAAVHDNLPVLHEYYETRRTALGLDKLRHYDVRVPLTKDITMHHTYEQAVNLVLEALAPLGEEYCGTLRKGLTGGWVDRYENKGKRSGAFSAGTYKGDPYILLNYKDDDIRDVFTLAHEAGHSMHSLYSARNNPFQHYSYTIFEAEVASTFNEQLLTKYFMDRAETAEMRAYLVGKQIDDIIGTLFRQTMFAEFEHTAHAMAESGTPLTLESLRQTYQKLLETYFGPSVVFEDTSALECLRIPHFYTAFYVYKYATGLSAAIALSVKVLTGGNTERDKYFAFLKSGGSKFPLESLKAAGVDMREKEPVQTALDTFKSLVQELKTLLGADTKKQ